MSPSPPKVPVLAYHAVGESTLEQSMTVSLDLFLKQMRWLHAQGFTGVSAESAFLKPMGMSSGRVVVLTFDDGFESIYTNVFPILRDLGYGATLFVCPDYIDGDRVPHGNREPRSISCLSWSQLKEMMAFGFTVGSHTKSHPLLATLSDVDADLEIRQSKEVLEEPLGVQVKSFAYPSGQFNSRLKELVIKAGYELGFCVHLARHQKEDRWCLQRIGISGHDGMFTFRLKMSRLYKRILDRKRARVFDRTWLIDLLQLWKRRSGARDVGLL